MSDSQPRAQAAGDPSDAGAALTGRHAVVTGASRGIGAAIAEALLNQGARVSLLSRDVERARRIVETFGSQCASAIAVDVSDADSVRRAMAEARERFGAIHVLVNNAGQAASAPILKTEDALWRQLFAVNVDGTFFCTRHALPDMLQAGFGRIVNIASVAGLRGAPYISAYAATKHAVIGFTRSLALELAKKNITVNAVCPGYTDTDIVREAVANIVTKTGRTEQEALAGLTAANPQGRLIRPAEVAQAVVWLCSPGAESITGLSLPVAGGEGT